jgi:primase-polymerase (primpol)-like protein
MQNHKKYAEMFEDIERQFFKDDDEKACQKAPDISFSFAINAPVEHTKVLKRDTFEPPLPKKSNAAKIVEEIYSKTLQRQSAAKVGQKRPLHLTQISPFSLETEKRAKLNE